MTTTISESELNVTVYVTILYAQYPGLASTEFIKELFPTFTGDNWEEIEQQIAYRDFINGTEYYMCERLDHKEFTDPDALRRVSDDEFVSLDDL